MKFTQLALSAAIALTLGACATQRPTPQALVDAQSAVQRAQTSMNKAVEGGTYADPVRKSVFDTTFKRVAADQFGYLETFETVIGESKIQFTPQKKFFDTTQNWAVALQDIYGGDDAASRLRSLAKTNTSKVNL